MKVKILADWKDQKSIDINDIFKEIAKELEYKNTFEGAMEELKKAAENAMVPLVEALEELAKTINEALPSSDEAAAALTNLYKSLEGNHEEDSYSPAMGSLKSLGKKEETYATGLKSSHEPIEITFEEKDLLEKTNLNDWYDNFLKNL